MRKKYINEAMPARTLPILTRSTSGVEGPRHVNEWLLEPGYGSSGQAMRNGYYQNATTPVTPMKEIT